MPAIIEKKNCTGEFLDDGQYSRNGILRYERIFGDTFVSTGGVETTKVAFLILRVVIINTYTWAMSLVIILVNYIVRNALL